MGETSGYLLRSFSQPSSTSCEFKEGDDPLRCLTTSISFGRFMTEPLAWEKWSSFSQNRILEEVQKFARPGSVAEKKAYFEAHYKKIAAKKSVASLEQVSKATRCSPEPNIVANNILGNSSMGSKQDEAHNASPEPNATNIIIPSSHSMPSDLEKSDTSLVVDSTLETTYTSPCTTPLECDNNVDENLSVIIQVGLAETLTEQVSSSKNCVQDVSSNQLEDAERRSSLERHNSILLAVNEKQGNEHPRPSIGLEGTAAEVELAKASTEQVICTELLVKSGEGSKTYIKDAAAQRVKVRAFKKKPDVSIRSSSNNGLPKQWLTSIQLRKEESKKKPEVSSFRSSSNNGASKLRINSVQPNKKENATFNMKASLNTTGKKRSTPQSLHMSVDFASATGNGHSMSSILVKNLENLRLPLASSDKAKAKSTQQAPTRVSVSGVSKNSIVLPQPENRRFRTPLDHSVLGSRSVVGKLPSTPAKHSKLKSATVPSSFSFKSEERAAKRKEFFQKLEEKLKTKESEKVQVQARLKEKTEKNHKNVQQCTDIGTKPSTTIRHEICPPSNNMKKIQANFGRKQMPSTNQYQPPWRSTVKTSQCKNVVEKNKRLLTRSTISLPKKNIFQNTSSSKKALTHSTLSLPKKNKNENTSPNIQPSS